MNDEFVLYLIEQLPNFAFALLIAWLHVRQTAAMSGIVDTLLKWCLRNNCDDARQDSDDAMEP